MFLEDISFKMTPVQGCKRPRRECPSIAPSIALSDFSLPSNLDNKLSEQLAEPSRRKPPITIAITNIPRYSKDDLQRIFRTVLEARAPNLIPTTTPAPFVSEAPRDKVKARSMDKYYEKSHMDCYNFCQ